MDDKHRSGRRRAVKVITVAGTAAAIAIGGGLAGAGTASADSRQNVVTSTCNAASPNSTIGDFTTNLSHNIGVLGTNLLVNTGTVGTNLEINGGKFTGNLVQNTSSTGGHLVKNTGQFGGNLVKNTGQFGGNLVKNIGKALSGKG